MHISAPGSVVDLSLLRLAASADVAGRVESNILALFDRHAASLLAYAQSFGLGNDDAEDVVQETFLALFRHVRLGRDQSNLAGWLFQVTHNLALKERTKRRRRWERDVSDERLVARRVNTNLDPEAQLVQRERRRLLRAVVEALPARERRCLLLRAEGLTYRDIAAASSLSLGAVAKALTRAMTRLLNADGG